VTQRVNVSDSFRSDILEIAQISDKANLMADRTVRILLEYLLPEPETITKKTLDSQTKFYKDVGTIITSLIGLFDRTGELSRGIALSRELDDRTEELRKEEIKRAVSLIYELEFQDLLSYFFDLKLKGHKFVFSNLDKYPSAKKIRVIESREKRETLEFPVTEYSIPSREDQIHIPKYVPADSEPVREIPIPRYVPAETNSTVHIPRYIPAEPEPESEASDENIGKINDEEGDDNKE